jgi:MoaA/NifB/PqqE/SkfB family radical SAM enzyme
MHQFIGQNFTKPCCDFTESSTLTPLQYWNSKELATVRTELENGMWPKGCSSCKYQEKNNQISLRQRSLNEYSIPDTPNVEYVDLRLSNKCNFACRSCEPIFSSRISKESNAHNLKDYYGYSLDKNYVEHTEQISNDIKEMIPKIKKLMFTGGEPTYIKQFYDILDTCDTNINLLITTNASMIDDKFLEYAKRFHNLHITLSIDAVGKSAEYIRYGSIWKTIDQNIQKILSLKCSVMYNTVLSAYSVPYVESLVDYIIKNEQDAYGADMYICNYPQHLNPCVLPKEFRNYLTEQLNRSIVKLSNSKRAEDYYNAIQVLKSLIVQLDTDYRDNTKFKTFTDKLDTIRNQKYDYRDMWTNW